MDSPPAKASQQHLERLRQFRVRAERDVSMGFLADQFKRDVARPFKQLGDLIALWHELVPEEVAAGTRLESLQRGVLTVAVDSSARLYEVDRRLREGLELQLITRHKGPAFRRVKLRVAADGWGA
ncbi:MAG: DciA family protein [Planctomycetota bacterium]